MADSRQDSVNSKTDDNVNRSNFRARTSQVTTDSDAAIISTNDSAFLTKISAMRAGYISDPYLESMRKKYESALLIDDDDEFAPRQQRYQPVMNRATYARILIKDRVIEHWLDSTYPKAKHLQILSLGAGFDTSLFRALDKWKQNNANHDCFLSVVELDLHEVVQSKRLLADEFLNQTTSALFNSSIELNNQQGYVCEMVKNKSHPCNKKANYRYALLPRDLRNLNSLAQLIDPNPSSSTLSDTSNRDGLLASDRATLIISEMSLVYLPAGESDAVITHLSHVLQNEHNLFFNLEPVGSATEFGRQMAENIAARGSTLLGLRAYSDIASQRERFKRFGWTHCVVQSMLDVWINCLSANERISLQRIEMLDELEELNLLLNHYCIVLASKSENSNTNIFCAKR